MVTERVNLGSVEVRVSEWRMERVSIGESFSPLCVLSFFIRDHGAIWRADASSSRQRPTLFPQGAAQLERSLC